MSHQRIQDLLEKLRGNTPLPEESGKEVEAHLLICQQCRDYLYTIRLTRGIVRASQPGEHVTPGPGFSGTVIRQIERERETFLFWRPMWRMAMQAIPVMAALAVVLGILAYSEVSSLIQQHQASNPQLVEAFSDLTSGWGQERSVLSDSISQDSDRVVTILLADQNGTTVTERKDKP